jgi:hypothetical protein
MIKPVLSPLAQIEIGCVADEHNCEAPDLEKLILRAVKLHFTQTAISQTDWFKKQTEHCVFVARIRKEGKAVLELHLVANQSGMVYSSAEKELPDEYHVAQLLEETRLDTALGIIK